MTAKCGVFDDFFVYTIVNKICNYVDIIIVELFYRTPILIKLEPRTLVTLSGKIRTS